MLFLLLLTGLDCDYDNNLLIFLVLNWRTMQINLNREQVLIGMTEYDIINRKLFFAVYQ